MISAAYPLRTWLIFICAYFCALGEAAIAIRPRDVFDGEAALAAERDVQEAVSIQ